MLFDKKNFRYNNENGGIEHSSQQAARNVLPYGSASQPP
jgi:hypothetical protein